MLLTGFASPFQQQPWPVSAPAVKPVLRRPACAPPEQLHLQLWQRFPHHLPLPLPLLQPRKLP